MQNIQKNMHYQAFDMAIVTLKDMRKNEGGTVYDVPDFRLLASLGIRIGKSIKVLSKSFAGGPMILAVNGRSIVIDKKVAEKIIVRR